MIGLLKKVYGIGEGISDIEAFCCYIEEIENFFHSELFEKTVESYFDLVEFGDKGKLQSLLCDILHIQFLYNQSKKICNQVANRQMCLICESFNKQCINKISEKFTSLHSTELEKLNELFIQITDFIKNGKSDEIDTIRTKFG